MPSVSSFTVLLAGCSVTAGLGESSQKMGKCRSCVGNDRLLRFFVFTFSHSSQTAVLNPLTPNDHYSGRTAPLTSKRCILYVYSTNIGTEYFKHGIYCPFFPLQIAVCFIILTYLVPVLFTFYIQSVLNVAFYIFIQQI